METIFVFRIPGFSGFWIPVFSDSHELQVLWELGFIGFFGLKRRG